MGPDQSKIDALEKRMQALGICAGDIEAKFVKGSGRGGQKVNKTNNAVSLMHKPTGIRVKCSRTRSRHLNRFLALRNLVDKIQLSQTGQLPADREKLARIRKQKQKRKHRARKKAAGDGLSEGA